jgi:hypothetical protein
MSSPRLRALHCSATHGTSKIRDIFQTFQQKSQKSGVTPQMVFVEEGSTSTLAISPTAALRSARPHDTSPILPSLTARAHQEAPLAQQRQRCQSKAPSQHPRQRQPHRRRLQPHRRRLKPQPLPKPQPRPRPLQKQQNKEDLLGGSKFAEYVIEMKASMTRIALGSVIVRQLLSPVSQQSNIQCSHRLYKQMSCLLFPFHCIHL